MTLKNKRILLTGGAGFIGTSLAQRLVDDNELVLLDCDFERKPAHFTDLARHKNVTLVKGSVLDSDILATAVDGVDVIVHLAAVVGVQNVLARARTTIEVNFTGTANLLHAIQHRARDLHRFVFFSTSEVFGGASFRVEEAHHASIGNVQEARWSYSIAKLAGEHLSHAYHREFGLPTVIVRPFNVFGPLRTGDHALLRFAVAALRNQPIEVHGDGSQVRSWCYIDDFVDGIIATMEKPAAVGQDFNLGNARNTLTIYETAKRVVALAHSSSSIRFSKIDFPDIDIRVPHTQKARELLGYEPKIEMNEAVERTVAWYREHLDHFKYIE